MEIVKHEVTVETSGGKMPCHLARPASGGPYPGMVVIMEAFGFNQNIKNITDRFAAEGFVAISPDLYFRVPDNVASYSDVPKAVKLMEGATDEQVVGDMAAVISYLKAQKDVKPKVGTTGFCMGGRIAFLTAVRNPAVGATAPFLHGGGMTRPGAGGGKAPTDLAANLKGPVLAFFGGLDQFIPMTEVDTFRDALKKAAKPHDIVLYGDADHGFMCEERSQHNPARSREAWAKVIAFFKENLG